MFALITPVRTVLLATVVFMLGFAVAAPAQTTWYVDDDAAPGGDGTSWPAAFEYLQDALTAAGAGDEIRVAQGIYKPDRDCDHPDGTGDREATFQLITGVALFGGYAGLSDPNDPDARDLELYESILSGDLSGNDEPGFVNYEDNSLHVVTAINADANTALDGFTVTGGNALLLPQPANLISGGGMYVSSSAVTISNCVFIADYASYGGGAIYLLGCSNATIDRCQFVGNKARAYGSGVYFRESTGSLLANCCFTDNDVNYGGGGAGQGGGIGNLQGSSTSIYGCLFDGNSSVGSGGGVFNYGFSSMTIVHCIFSGNFGGAHGGIATNWGSYSTVADCAFYANSAPHGRALSCSSGGFGYPSTVNTSNCILWDGGDEIWNADGSTIAVTFSDVQGGWGGEGNIDANPLFVDPDGPDDDPNTWEDNDYRLDAGSPCIDAADNEAVPADTLDLDGDGDTDEPIPFDLDGNPRFVDDPDTDDTGNGTPPIVDMGAYEFQAGPVAYLDIKPGSCPNPLNRNSHGVLPVALVGTEDFDVTQVDLDSLELTRADGVGGSVTPLMGPPGPGIRVEDVATPFDGEPCDCHELEGDGIADLAMKFDTPELVAVLELDDLPGGSSVELVVSGELLDATHFSATDCVILVPPGSGPGALPAQSGPKGDGVDAVPKPPPDRRLADPDAAQDGDAPDKMSPQLVGCGVLPPGFLLTATAAMYLISRARPVARLPE